MSFSLRPYTRPDFSESQFVSAPDAVLKAVEKDGVAPEYFHAMSIFPEYFKIDGEWMLAKASRMDCVAVWENGNIIVREFRLLKKGDLVVLGRTENCEEGIYLHADGFRERPEEHDTFAFRTNRSRETAFSKEYDDLYELLRYERENGRIVWVMGPAFAFDADARRAFSGLIANGFVHAVLAGKGACRAVGPGGRLPMGVAAGQVVPGRPASLP